MDKNGRELRRAMVRWLEDQRIDTLATVTLKQALPNEGGGLTMITDDIRKRTAWICRDRVTKAVIGQTSYRRGDRIPFLVFGEGGDGIIRSHLHILIGRPECMSIDDFRTAFVGQVRGINWVHNEIDIKAITHGTDDRVIKYCLKEGLDAFCPEASALPDTVD